LKATLGNIAAAMAAIFTIDALCIFTYWSPPFGERTGVSFYCSPRYAL